MPASSSAAASSTTRQVAQLQVSSAVPKQGTKSERAPATTKLTSAPSKRVSSEQPSVEEKPES
eukprot:1047428-Prorocentrum_lima.AAC.1